MNFVSKIFENSISGTQNTHYKSITTMNLSAVFKKTYVSCSENHMEHEKRMFG
jgi:hypothetical protein